MSHHVVFAVAAHPDDIELMMAGTMLMLGRAGCELHYINLCNGCMGTADHDPAAIAAIRAEEAREAARILGATWHPPMVDDLDLFYDRLLPRRLGAIIREVRPTIMLLQSPHDYMEDHMNACRVAVTAAFTRGMRNFFTEPLRDPIDKEVTLYHALPWGLRDPLRRIVRAGQYVDITSVVPAKRAALAAHKSQKEWLDRSQGLDSYLTTMEEMAKQVGGMSGKFEYAEGWRRHLHLGFCAENADPLSEVVGDMGIIDTKYARNIEE
ncbi:MAG: PIG-L family deacetylase [Candidatus Hydrogenedentes bacterium]|nr:PIG-L family deacetylase [Candidatus Hydrogenedentota bacterium]